MNVFIYFRGININMNDFRAFCKAGECPEKSARTISRLRDKKIGGLAIVTARAPSFLTNMVRIIVGSLDRVGRGEEPAPLDYITANFQDYPHIATELEKHIASHIMMLGSPHYSEVVDLDKAGVTKFQSIDLKPMLASVSGKDRAGSYLVGFRQLDGSDNRRRYVRVDVTDLCLSVVEARHRVVFGVTSYTNGKPVPDAQIKVYGLIDTLTAIAHGKTNSNGFFSLEHTPEISKIFKQAVEVSKIVVSKGDDVLVTDLHQHRGLQVFEDNHWYSMRTTLRWLEKDRYSEKNDKKLRGIVRTERPLYRPGDSVYIKGYVRETIHGKINLPPAGMSYRLIVRSPSQVTVDYPVKLNEFGSFDLKIAPHEPSTGEYQVSLVSDKKCSDPTCTRSHGTNNITSTDFMVEAYRIPRFEVRLRGADKIPNDAPAEVRAAATYYAGGRVVDQNIAWKVTSFPYHHTPRGFAGYILSSDERYGTVTRARRQSVLEENGKTDENGSARITLNPQAATTGNPTRYIVEATVTGADKQTVSATHSTIALPPFILGLRAERHITTGSTISARVVAIGVNDSLVAGQKVNVELKKVSWTSYLAETDFSRGKPKYITDEAVDRVEERTVVTDGKPLLVEFKDQEPGVYILELSSRDRLGRLHSLKIDLFLAGSSQQAWKKTEQNVFETVTDRNSYEPGQQAKIRIKSPYRRAVALAVVERPDGDIQYRWININDSQGSFTLDIRQDMAPRIPVSFLLMRPRTSIPRRSSGGMEADAGKPQTVGNTTWLTVNPVANQLDVRLTHAPVTTPDGTLDVTIQLRDSQGKPRFGEVALWLVDEAVLSLRKEKSLDPLEAFLEEVSSRITLRDSRNFALGNLHTVENPGGGGGDFEGDGMLGRITVRKNFKTVPYWNPSIKIDKSGNAVVKVPMSSDLTNYSVRAMAISGTDRFGTAKSRVSVRLPVIVQPALPRFVRLGDKIKAGGIARVVEGGGGAATWSINTNGLTVTGAARGQIQLDTLRPIPLIADLHVETPPFTAEGRLQWDSVSVKMVLMRTADKAGDAFEIKIPVLPDRQFIEETQFAQVNKGESFSWKALPEQARANTVLSNLLISDNQYLPKIISAMTSLVRYPYGCTEQVVSQSYPSLVYNDLWDRYGIASPDPSVTESVNRTLEFLKTAQHGDGLFGYWPKAPGYVYLTAYVVDFLTEVKNANKTLKQPYAFDEKMYTAAIEALKRSLRSDYRRFVSGYSSYERTSALAALARSGHVDIGYARELAAAANDLDVQGKANIFNAITSKQNALGSEYAMLEKLLWESPIFIEHEGAEAFAGFRESRSRLGARMHSTDAVTLASFISAVSPSQNKNSERVKLLANELVKSGSGDGWGSVHANSMSLLALREFIDGNPSPSKNTFSFNDGDKSHQLTMSGAISRYWSNGKEGNVTHTSVDQPNNTFWLQLRRRYMPQTLGSAAEPEQRGFAVKRGIIRIVKGSPAEKIAIDKGGSALTFTSGDIVEEHIQVVNPEARFFVAVSIPIAAGFEPLNPMLENSSSDASPFNKTTNEGDYSAFNDDRVVYFFERMEQGTYDFYFRTRAITEGEFSHPPAKTEMMYQMSVYGTSAGSRIIVNSQ
jgi:uncharacterized protein YfaS (alpha-2-macroglobulin family)